MSNIPCGRSCQLIDPTNVENIVNEGNNEPTKPEPVIKMLPITGNVEVVEAKDAGKGYIHPIYQDTRDYYLPPRKAQEESKSFYRRAIEVLYSGFDRVLKIFTGTHDIKD